jgi:hypothetical protein
MLPSPSPPVETIISVYAASLKAAVDEAELRLKYGTVAQVEESLRTVRALRRSFNGEMQFLPPEDKKLAAEALRRLDARIRNCDVAGVVPSNSSAPSDIDSSLKATATVQLKTTDALQRTLKRATEARDLGGETLETLNAQQQQLVRVDATIADIDTELGLANRTLAHTARRVATDRLVLCFALLLICAITAVVAVVVVTRK